MELMQNQIRPYAWGSRTAIAELLGDESPAPHPQAEMWIGAHPADSSELLGPDGSTSSLAELIAEDPVSLLGERATQAFGPRLPYLLKVLAAAEPLSLQAHPSAAQARHGFTEEERAGVPLSASSRNYKDSWHKPELICALTEFHALCGFRDPDVTVRLLAGLQVPALDHYLALLDGQRDSDGTRALFSSIITMPSSVLAPLLEQVLASCVNKVQEGGEFVTEFRTALELGERYPGDAGVLASLLLNRVTLEPGEALYLPAGNLHAYLSGVGVEIMANSDNVLRGGLTPKHVDVPELMRVLDFAVGPVPVISGTADESGEWNYRTPTAEFQLSRIEIDDHERDVTHAGPQVLLVVDGEATLRSGDGAELKIPRGRSAWVSASDSGVRLSGKGTVFRATDGVATIGVDAPQG